MERRSFMEGVAALAGVRWADQDVDVDELTSGAEAGDDPTLEEIAAERGGPYTTGEFTPPGFMHRTGFRVGEIVMWGDDFDEFDLAVQYDYNGPYIAQEFASDDGDQVDLMTKLTPEQARQLGAALYQAAEEHESRWEN